MANEKLKFTNLKVGLTVFVGVVIFFFFIILVGTESNFFSSNYKLKIFLKSVEGFNNGSMVTLGGLKIGSISELNYAAKGGVNGIDIILSVDKKYQPQITQNSIASVKTKGLLGDKYIDISIGQTGEKPLTSGSYLPIEEPVSIDAFTKKLEPAANNLDSVLQNLNKITSNLNSNKSALGVLLSDEHTANEITNIVRELRSFTNAVSNQKGTLGKLAFNDSLYKNLNDVSTNLSSISNSLNEGKGTLGKLINEDSLFNNFKFISSRLDVLLSKTESDSTLIGGLLNDKKFYNDFNSLLKDLDKLIIDLKENPDRYVQFSVF